MVSLQIISKVLASKDYSLISNNLLTEDYFPEYTLEYNFIKNHYEEYNQVPDKATFLSKFPDIELVEVQESDTYLVDAIREEYLYGKLVPVIQQAAKLLQSDSNAACEYLLNTMQNTTPNYKIGGVDIISQAKERHAEYLDRKQHQDTWYYNTGFKELDNLIHGIARKEELVVIVARINNGKSWILEKICEHILKQGANVGYISPEMSANSIGYRFDTLHANFSNSGLMWGSDTVNDTEYTNYINDLTANSRYKFIVSTPKDFDRRITISKLRKWKEQNNLDVIAIDGITYLSDERAERGDTLKDKLTHISEDLMSLSVEMNIPVLVVAQSNRMGVREEDTDDTPDLDNIKDSDGIGANASKVISLKQINEVLDLHVKKQRFGPVGGKLKYNWDIDTGNFNFIQECDRSERPSRNEDKPNRRDKGERRRTENAEDVF